MNFLNKVKDEIIGSSGSSGSGDEWYITAVRAEGVRDVDFWTKSDPYLKIEFGGKHFKTRVIKNDTSPNWNETFHVKLDRNHVGDVNLWLMDDNLGFDDHLGKATITEGELPLYSTDEKFIKIPLYRKDQVTAVVHLRVRHVPLEPFSSGPTSTSTSTYTNSNYRNDTSYQQPYQHQQMQQPLPQQPPMSYDGMYNNPEPYRQGQFSQGQFSQGTATNYVEPRNQPNVNTNINPNMNPNMNPNDNSNSNYYGNQFQERRF